MSWAATSPAFLDALGVLRGRDAWQLLLADPRDSRRRSNSERAVHLVGRHFSCLLDDLESLASESLKMNLLLSLELRA